MDTKNDWTDVDDSLGLGLVSEDWLSSTMNWHEDDVDVDISKSWTQ